MAFGDFIGGVVNKHVNSAVNKGVQSVAHKFSTLAKTNLNSFIKGGSEQILNAVGAHPLIRDAVRSINSTIVNAGVKSASDLFDGILKGTVTTSSLSKFASLDVVKAALKGNDKVAQALNNLNTLVGLGQSLTSPDRPSSSDIPTELIDSPYAVDFADTFTPKFKFMFVVEFVFNPPFGSMDLFGRNTLHTVIHKFERPKIDIEHEEVNLYNFYTNVPKRIKYNPVSITAHDDIQGGTVSTLVAYLRSISPIFNMNASTGAHFEDVGGLAYDTSNAANLGTIQQSSVFENYGLTEGSNQSTVDTGYLDGPIDNQAAFAKFQHDDATMSIFKEIKVHHVYDFGKYVDTYSFYNPRITTIAFDELDMSVANQGNAVTFEIVYDGLYIDVKKAADQIGIFAEINFDARYNLTNRSVASGDSQRAQQLQIQEDLIAAKTAAKDAQRGIDRQIDRENRWVLGTDEESQRTALQQEQKDLLKRAGFENENDAEIELFLREKQMADAVVQDRHQAIRDNAKIVASINKATGGLLSW